MKKHGFLKIMILAALFTLLSAIPAFARSTKKAAEFPYSIELDVEEVERLCYAGHRGDVINYMPGRAVTPDTGFRLLSQNDDPAVGSKDLRLEIAVLYETDTKRAYREVIRKYDYGDITLGETYNIFSDLNISNLEERGKLYSDSLKGLEFRLSCRTKDQNKKEKCWYFHVCSEEDYDEYLSKLGGEEEAESGAQ